MKYRCVIWDWNGTLADDLMASLQATNDILAMRGMAPISLQQYYSYIDTPISRFYEHLFDLNEFPMEEIGQAFGQFYPKYFQGLHVGAAELMKRLRDAEVQQVILSSSHRDTVRRDAGRLGILPWIDEVLAADDYLGESKQERGLRWLEHQTVSRTNVVLIGDTLHDYDTARAMGVDCILCAFGHQARQDLLRTGVPVADSFSHLEKLLQFS